MQLSVYPALLNSLMPLIVIYIGLIMYIFPLLCFPSFDTHGARLLFCNIYILFGQILYFSWYGFVIYNDYWDNGPYIMCRDDTSHPKTPGTAAFDVCREEV